MSQGPPHQGQILDGRNRHRACLELGVTPKFREWDGRGSLVALIVGLNLNRRHLNASQRAMIGARIKPAFEDEARKRQATSTGGANPQLKVNSPEAEKGQARDKAAATVNVSPRLVESASHVQKNGTPELVGMVEAGEVAVCFIPPS